MSQSNIYPKTCTYGCGLQIYWNTSVNEYWEVLTQKKHICTNRQTNKSTTTSNSTYYCCLLSNNLYMNTDKNGPVGS